jgi:hypothetical protein
MLKYATGTTKTGPNDAKRVVALLGESFFFLSRFLLLIDLL